jgi:putative endopeptidase
MNYKTSLYFSVNKKWLQNTRIPESESSWGVFQELRDKNKKRLINLAKSSNNKCIKILWSSAINTKRINRDGLKHLKLLSADIDKLKTKKQQITALGKLMQLGATPFINFNVESDYRNTSINIGHINQDGLGMPNSSYYLDNSFKSIKNSYLDLLEQFFTFYNNGNKKQGLENAITILNLETKIAKQHMTSEHLRDPNKTCNTMMGSDLKHLAPFFKSLGLKKINELEFTVENVAYVKYLAKWKWSVSDVNLYFKWCVIRSLQSAYPDKLRAIFFNFYGKTLSGIEIDKSQEEHALSIMNHCLGHELGKEYVDAFFPSTHKDEILLLAEQIKTAFKQTITDSDWMSIKTKERAQLKLAKMNIKIGYPDKFDTPDATTKCSELQLKKQNTLMNNIITTRRYSFDKDIEKIGKPIDITAWEMLPQHVNAYYHPLRNEIVFPAGILQDAFYSSDDANKNFGAIGVIIGHEITHGFDDSGALFDENGQKNNWWLKKDKTAFQKKTKKVIEHYNGVGANGQLTLGENIADLGGIKVALRAFKNSGVRSDADLRQFFKSYATVWRHKTTPEAIALQHNTDPHSSGHHRVDCVVQNLDDFDRVFNIKYGDAIHKPNKITVW